MKPESMSATSKVELTPAQRDRERQYEFGAMKVDLYSFARDLSFFPKSEELRTQHPDLYQRLHTEYTWVPPSEYPSEAPKGAIRVGVIALDEDIELSKSTIQEGASPVGAAIRLLQEMKSGLSDLVRVIRENPDSELAKTNYFIGASRLADVSERLASSLGIEIYNPDSHTDFGSSHHMAMANYQEAGLDEDAATALAYKKDVKLAVITREKLLQTYPASDIN